MRARARQLRPHAASMSNIVKYDLFVSHAGGRDSCWLCWRGRTTNLLPPSLLLRRLSQPCCTEGSVQPRGGDGDAWRWPAAASSRNHLFVPVCYSAIATLQSELCYTWISSNIHMALWMHLRQHTCVSHCLCWDPDQSTVNAGEIKPFADQLAKRLGGDKGRAEASLGLRAFIDRNGLKPGDNSVKVRNPCHRRMTAGWSSTRATRKRLQQN